MEFLNGSVELQRLKKALSREQPVLVVLYGRRRIGKSRLLQEMTGNKDIYYLADENDRSMQIYYFSQIVARKIPGFDEVTYPDWRTVFQALNNSLRERITLILDEFPYLVKSTPGLPSVIQNSLDQLPDRRFNLVLCGSSQRMMQGYVLGASTPLYGRAREIINLKGLKIDWLRKALRLKAIEAVETYSVVGGVPRYWELLSEYPDLWSALRDLVFDRYGILREEPIRLFQDETDAPASLLSLCGFIGGGAHRLSEIAGRMQKKATDLSRPLQQLMEMGYVKRELPFGESLRSTKRTLYKLSDHYMRFYFRFVAPNQTFIEMGEKEEILEQVRSRFNHFVSETAEEIVRERVAEKGLNDLNFKGVSRWWGRNRSGKPMEIDLLAESADRRTLLIGEVKWEERIDFKSTVDILKAKAEQLPFKHRNRFLTLWVKHEHERTNLNGVYIYPTLPDLLERDK